MKDAHASPTHPGRAALEQAPDAFERALTELTERLDGSASVDAAAGLVVSFVLHHLGCDRADVAIGEGPDATAYLGDHSSPRMPDDAVPDPSLTSGLGPGEMITVGDTRARGRGSGWATAAAELGFRSAQLVAMPPLRGRATRLQMFWLRAQVFSPEEHDRARRVAMHAGYSIRHVDRVANLVTAMSTRAIIGQAQGIIMERHQLNSARAMSFLRRRSQETQTRIRDVASLIVAGHDRELPPGSGRDGRR